MAILTITNGESTELAVTKIPPIEEACFTLYEYRIVTNIGDSVAINITGNHYDAKYITSSSTVSFSDDATVTYNNYLAIRFLLLNSNTTGVYTNATITITNTTLSKYYNNFVQRANDTANCYGATNIPTLTSQLFNDGSDGTDVYVEIADLGAYLPKGGGSAHHMMSDLHMGDYILMETKEINFTSTTSDVTGNRNIAYRDDVDKWQFRDNNSTLGYFASEAYVTAALAGLTDDQTASEVGFTSYGTIGSVNVQDAIEELKDELDALVAGTITTDAVPTDGSTNPVESNGVYDALQTKAGLTVDNYFTGTGNMVSTSFMVRCDVSDNGSFKLRKNGSTDLAGEFLYDSTKVSLKNNTSGEALSLMDSGDSILTSLSGTGTRMVVAGPTGTLATQTVPSGSMANLSYTASPTAGTINNTNGSGFGIPAGSTSDASLMLPADKTLLDGYSAANVPDMLITKGSGTSGIVLSGSTSGTYTVGSQTWNYVQLGPLVFFHIYLSGISGSSPTGNLQVDISGTAMSGVAPNTPGACASLITDTGASGPGVPTLATSQASNLFTFLLEGTSSIPDTLVCPTFSSGTITISGTLVRDYASDYYA